MRKPLVIDVYHRERIASLESVYDAGIRGIIHKATQGTHFSDPKYAGRKKWALENNFLWGAYHFGTAQPVGVQVDKFLSLINYDGDTLLALDYEPDNKNGTMSIDAAREWLEQVYKRTGQRPVIYSGHLIKERVKSDPDGFWGKHRLWLAQYGPKPVMPAPWSDFWLWQYTDTGKLAGIRDQVDLNYFNGDEQQLRDSWAVEESSSVPGIIDNNGSAVLDTISSVIDWQQAEKDDDLPDAGTSDQSLKWLDIAKSLIGTKEAPGSRDNPTIIRWARSVGLSRDYTHDSIPWCGLYVAYVCSQAGLDVSSAPLWALSWKNWGQHLKAPAYGCVVVFKRNGGGHVGFAVGQDDTYYHVLGGNQSDTVNISKIAKSRCVGYRWPDGYDISLAKPLPHQSINATITENEA